jgi:hypothetical protein
MNIRNAAYHDAPVIKILLEVLGYKTTTNIRMGKKEGNVTESYCSTGILQTLD